ncbi:MAG: response regulator transcription factor [Chlorobi bacterium]|nr:response regulator transcription factor [Chlorobiota bacterium]
MNILIADDHAVVRRGVKEIVTDSIKNVSIDEAENAESIYEALKNNTYDLILLDISLPDENGISVLQNIKILFPELPILILSNYEEKLFAKRSLKLGASGYLTKSAAPEELSLAIKTVQSGKSYISKNLAERFVFDSAPEILPHEKLSSREFEVLLLIADGKTVGEISRELFLSPKTVSTYRSRILEKMEMDNNSKLINYAVKNNLL